MKGKVLFLVAGATGYVLGARAGRERYDQIANAAGRVWGNPKVQQRVDVVSEKATDAAKQAGAAAGAKVSETASSVAGSVKEKVSGSGDASSSGASGTGGSGENPLGDQHHTRLPTD